MIRFWMTRRAGRAMAAAIGFSGLLMMWMLAGCGPSGSTSRESAGKEASTGHAEEAPGSHEGHGHEEESGEAHDEHGEASHDAHGEESNDEHAEDEAIRLTTEQRRRAGITMETASSATIGRPLELPGEVVLDADRLSHIVPRFPGVAKEVKKRLGDRVKAGEVLAIINSNQSLSTYDVTSLTDGVIIEKHITLGEFVTDNSDIYVVADLSQVWVNMTVYPRDMSEIRIGQQVDVSVTGLKDEVRGKISYIGPIVGEVTRTAMARVVLPNKDGALRPGLFVTARVLVSGSAVPVAVRDIAIQTLEGRTVVFLEEGDGVYLAQLVETGVTDGEWTEIRSGVSAGQAYVAHGSFLLKSEKLKSEAGHDH